MAIEIYDKASIVKKDDKVYWFVKYGSKNCFTCPYQTVTDDTWHNKFLRGQSRDSHWSLVAYGAQKELDNDKIASTWLNSPTSEVYGQIRFGNHLNIALWFVKNKDKILKYEELDEEQQRNIDGLLSYYAENKNNVSWAIDLSGEIPAGKQYEPEIEYCGNKYYVLDGHSVSYDGRVYWSLDNL
jgi:hypothetical protein